MQINQYGIMVLSPNININTWLNLLGILLLIVLLKVLLFIFGLLMLQYVEFNLVNGYLIIYIITCFCHHFQNIKHLSDAVQCANIKSIFIL